MHLLKNIHAQALDDVWLDYHESALCLVERQLQLVSCVLLYIRTLLCVPDVYDNLYVRFYFDFFNVLFFYIWSHLLIKEVQTATVQCFEALETVDSFH